MICETDLNVRKSGKYAATICEPFHIREWSSQFLGWIAIFMAGQRFIRQTMFLRNTPLNLAKENLKHSWKFLQHEMSSLFVVFSKTLNELFLIHYWHLQFKCPWPSDPSHLLIVLHPSEMALLFKRRKIQDYMSWMQG